MLKLGSAVRQLTGESVITETSRTRLDALLRSSIGEAVLVAKLTNWTAAKPVADIEGVIPLLLDTDLGCEFGDVWYNGWPQLERLPGVSPPDVLGAREGEFVGVLLEDAGLPWNANIDGGPVVVQADGELPRVSLEGGLTLTLLSHPLSTGCSSCARTGGTLSRRPNSPFGDPDAIREELHRRKYLPTTSGVLGSVEDGPPAQDSSEANGSASASSPSTRASTRC